MMLAPDVRCPNFDFGNKYFHLHGGIQIDVESEDEVIEPLPVIVNHYNQIQLEAAERLAKLTEPDTFQESYPMVVKEIGGKKWEESSVSISFDFTSVLIHIWRHRPDSQKWLNLVQG